MFIELLRILEFSPFDGKLCTCDVPSFDLRLSSRFIDLSFLTCFVKVPSNKCIYQPTNYTYKYMYLPSNRTYMHTLIVALGHSSPLRHPNATSQKLFEQLTT